MEKSLYMRKLYEKNFGVSATVAVGFDLVVFTKEYVVWLEQNLYVSLYGGD